MSVSAIIEQTMKFYLVAAVCCLLPAVAFAADRTSARVRAVQNGAQNIASRAAAVTRPTAVAARSATAIVSRSATPQTSVVQRSVIKQRTSAIPVTVQKEKRSVTAARAATVPVQTDVETLGDGYVACRDAYFSCMDQFCALRDEQYKRCMCSSRLDSIRQRESNFSAATTMLQSFQDNNLAVVDKTPSQVKTMYNATAGELAVGADTSSSKQALSGITGVLQSASKSDAADSMENMADIWGTTGIVGGSDIASLEGNALYEAVHAQCADLVAENCPRAATFNMVSSAYGMYIEQDCSAYISALDKTEREMSSTTKQAQTALQTARLQNYENHNSDSITACLANVRNDMFGDSACGKDNVKCIDYSGRFINVLTGEPIYTEDFYLLENAISLVGDTIKNNQNVPYINMLNQKKSVANASLDKCRDVSDYVWDEYLRQTLIDLSQRQFSAVRTVQANCVQVVSDCYDEKLEQLKQFSSDVSEENVVARQIELTEGMCKDKLETCALLYGGGPPGLEKLREFVRNSQTIKLENTCEEYLRTYATNVCTPVNDNIHSYPYACRFYRPGEKKTEESDTLYGSLRVRAKEVCTRTDTDALTDNVELIIAKIMDEVKLKMDEELSAECLLLEGFWHTRTLGTWDISQIDTVTDTIYTTFVNVVGAMDDWGVCTNIR